jgi:Na+/H+ antiporter NhaD/arsenite permease-like protein
VAVAVSSGGGANHALHAVLTFLSCGLWLPIWILVAIFDRPSSAYVGYGAGAGAGTPPQSKNRPLMIVGAVFLGQILLGTAAQHPWALVLLFLLAGVGGALFWVHKTAKDREELALREQYRRDVIADRADYENKLYYEGNPTGTYGRYMPPESLREEGDR